MLREVCYQGVRRRMIRVGDATGSVLSGVRGRMIHVGDATESVLSGGERSYDTCRRCYGKCVIRG